MTILVIAGNLPFAEHTVRAASQVLHCLLVELASRGHRVLLQVILSGESRRPWTAAEQNTIDEHSCRGVRTLPALFGSDYKRPDARITRLLRRFTSPVAYFYPEIALTPIIAERIEESRADAVLLFWNPEGLAATYGLEQVPKLAYYGMPDHVATTARLWDHGLFDLRLSRWQLARHRLDLGAWERAHLQLMMGATVTANLSADHAEYYSRNGHPRSVYIPNMWPPGPPRSRPMPSSSGPLRIVGSLGRPAATGNTYGLKFIGDEIVPRLDAALGLGGYELHIFGQGDPVPAVRRSLRSPNIRMRGFVENIDDEIQDAHVFLVANNTGPYRGSHTRFLHAWSLKACCVGHAYNATANPEMIHRDNVLLGETADELASLIIEAGRDEAMRRRVGEGGWKTYQEHFTPEAVVGKMLQELEPLVADRRVH